MSQIEDSIVRYGESGTGYKLADILQARQVQELKQIREILEKMRIAMGRV